MILEKIALLCLVIFALLGAAVLGIIIHEYSHFHDFKELNVTESRICGLVLPTNFSNLSALLTMPGGYYEFRTNKSDSDMVKKYNEISKNTEFKAYFASALALIFFVVCYMIIVFRRFKDEEKILEQKIDIEELVQDVAEKDLYIQELEKYIDDMC